LEVPLPFPHKKKLSGSARVLEILEMLEISKIFEILKILEIFDVGSI